ncbi:MAG: pyridoxamine 5'-phosphate oxidase family protein [Pseudomonadales bacterium]|nr:pyridoxamine 5'-phosphate oxidase family protein [Pseudomonadales bacterium]
MSSTDPIRHIKDDRVQARRLDDTNADICFLALATPEGRASVRTLVLRDITQNRFLLFMNQSSPKWKILTGGGDYELLLWYPSMQRQYRVSGAMEIADDDFVKRSWQRRPRGSKYLDILYEHTIDQSSYTESREQLVGEISRIRREYVLDEMDAPQKVAGIELVATRIEMLDLNREDRIHDRRMFLLEDGAWAERVMIP